MSCSGSLDFCFIYSDLAQFMLDIVRMFPEASLTFHPKKIHKDDKRVILKCEMSLYIYIGQLKLVSSPVQPGILIIKYINIHVHQPGIYDSGHCESLSRRGLHRHLDYIPLMFVIFSRTDFANLSFYN